MFSLTLTNVLDGNRVAGLCLNTPGGVFQPARVETEGGTARPSPPISKVSKVDVVQYLYIVYPGQEPKMSGSDPLSTPIVGFSALAD